MNAPIPAGVRRCFRTKLPSALCAAWALLASAAGVFSGPLAVRYDVVSDSSWVGSATAPAGWQETAFDDSAWADAVEITGYPYPPGTFIPGTAARYIWESGTTTTSPAYFRRSFWLPLPTNYGAAVVRVDDAFDFYVNGRLVGSEPGVHETRTYVITPFLRRGMNVFALKCTNLIGTSRAMLLDATMLTFPVLPRTELDVVSNTTWKGSPAEAAGWEQPEFDDVAWGNAIHVTSYPYPPGGYIPGTAGLHVWTTPLDSGTAYLRKEVQIDGYPDTSQAVVRVDDAYDFYVNGMLAGSKHTILPASAQTYDVTAFLRPGRNVFAVKGWDLGGQRAALFDADIRYYPDSAPVADAGEDKTISPGSTVFLTNLSRDDYTPWDMLRFAWSVETSPPGSAPALDHADAAYPGFASDLPGDYGVKLVVTDGLGATGEDLVTLTVLPGAVNGSFENGIDGWTASGNISVVSGPPYSSTDGDSLIAFNDQNRPPDGVLSQTFATVPSQFYQLDFDVGVVAFNKKQQVLGLEVPLGAQTIGDTIVLNGQGGGLVRWIAKTYYFQAVAETTNVIFRDLSIETIAIDLLLDNVRLTSIGVPLLVDSVPVNSVDIEVSPPIGVFYTPFERNYFTVDTVSLRAPETAFGGSFFEWRKDGATFGNERDVAIPMDTARRMTAVFWDGEPVVIGQPVDAAALEGGRAVFRVRASGGVPLEYQWRLEGNDISGANGSELAIDPVRADHQGSYDVVVRNVLGSATSDAAMLTVGSFAGLENGGFESDFEGWTVSGNASVKSGAPYVASEGVKLAAFNAANSAPDGVLFQMFGTTPGQSYVLGFDMGVLAYNKNAQSLRVEVAGSPNLVEQTFTMNGIGGGRVVWQSHALPFTADSPQSTVTFRDVSPGTNSIDLLLDNVTVTPVIARNLTVESTPVSVMMNVEPPDIHGSSWYWTGFTVSYADGTDVTLSAPDPWITSTYPVKGLEYRFVRWTMDGGEVGTAPEIHVTLDADKTLTAEYEPAPPATAFVNGSFEAEFDGWNATGNARVRTSDGAPDGTRIVEFNAGNTAPDGVLTQTFATEAGARYSMTYHVGVIAYNTNTQSIAVEVRNSDPLAAVTHSIRGLGKGKTVWETHALEFVASDAATTVSFRDLSPTTGSIDLLLDHVSVTMLPAGP